MSYKQIGTLILFLVATLLPRIIDLGSMLTIDEPLWRDRAGVFIHRIATFQFSETIPSIQPGVTTAWIIGLTLPFASLATAQASIAIASSILIWIITYFAIRLWGFKWGVITGFFLALNPFLIAHSRVAHTDALLALNSLASVFALLNALKASLISHEEIQFVRRYIFVSGIFAGLAMLTKLFALSLFTIVPFIILLVYWNKTRGWEYTLRASALWFAATIITVFVAWPALWTNGYNTVTHIFSSASEYTDTREDEVTSRWWYYIREGFFRSTVVTTLLLSLSVIAFALKRKSLFHKTMLLLLLAGILYATALSIRGEKSDRYILFTQLTVSITAMAGLRYIEDKIRQSQLAPSIIHSILILPLVWLAAEDIRLHPYYLAHYNRLYPIEERHKLGWGEGLELAAEWLTENHPTASVATFYERVFDYFYKGEGSVASLNHALDSADYAVLYRGMLERGQTSAEGELIYNFFDRESAPEPTHVIHINGLPYVWIFKLD